MPGVPAENAATRRTAARAAGARSGFDPATALGLLCGLSLIGAAIVIGGSASSFLNLPSLLIVLGGTLSAVTVCFSLPDVLRAARLAARAIGGLEHSISNATTDVLRLAEASRRNGLLSLQREVAKLDDDDFLHKGLTCLIDGMPIPELHALLGQDLMAREQRLGLSPQVLRRAAEFAPAMGLIGTLIGLVQMLGRLDDPSSIGPSMAVALLTTLYGAVLANLVFAPLATRLERSAATQAFIGQVQFTGVLSMARQENPRRLEITLNSMLPPASRVRYFD